MAGYRRGIPKVRAQSVAKKYRKKTWLFAMFFLGSFWYLEGMTAKAEPVSLQSPSAIIYAGTDEAGDRVGNLVQGSNFELLESVTAEDGSSWYHVAAFGTEGYIKGDAEIERGQMEIPEPRDDITQETGGEASETENGGVTGGPAQNENAGVTEESTQDSAETQDETEASEEDNDRAGEETLSDTEETTQGETEEETGILGNYAAAYGGNNAREKTYAGGRNSLKNIDVGDIPQDAGGEAADGGSAVTPVKIINKATLFFAAAAAGTVLAALISYGKLRRMFRQSKNTGNGFRKSGKNLGNEKTAHKKKKRRKKKGKSKKNGNTKKRQL